MIKKTSFAFLMLAAAAVFPIQSHAQAQTYSVQKFGGQTILVPQGVIKSGPRSYSAFDPANPYRAARDYNGKTSVQRASESRMPVVNTNGYCSGGPIIIVNPYVR